MANPVIQEWVAALRSGEFKQGKSSLHSIDANGVEKFCCLGVLCQQVKDDLNLVTEDMSEESDPWTWISYEGESGYLPQPVVNLLGISPQGMLPIPDNNDRKYKLNLSLTELNDNGFTFDQIADVIEWAFG